MQRNKGQGLLAQIEDSNKHTYYSQLTEKDVKKFIRDLIFKDTIQPRDKVTGKWIKGPRVSKQREYVYITNQAGYNEFNKRLQEEANKEWK